jgi:hypothetical protein
MAHFAQLDENNVVTQVIVVHNNECQIDGIESEDAGIVFCKQLYGANTFWKQTSYNGNFRKNYAGIGYSYLPAPIDGFAPPRPYESWNLDPDVCQWVAPVPMPTDGQMYSWNETAQAWEVKNGN